MFDTPSELIKHNQRISSLPHKDAQTDDLIPKETMFIFADYTIARAAASMLLDHGIDSDLFIEAMNIEQEFRCDCDNDE